MPSKTGRECGRPERSYTRRQVLRRGVTVVGAVGLAGCGSDGSSDGYRFRVDGGDWTALAPVETDETHQMFYHDGDATETTNATHDYVEADTATMFLHQNTTSSDGTDDVLVVTYDARSSDTGGQARLEFDEDITPDEHLMVADGPLNRESAQTGDTYAESHFVHQWGSGNTDGVVLSLEPFTEPTFEFTNTEGLEEIRILSAQDEGDPAVTRGEVTTTIEFQF